MEAVSDVPLAQRDQAWTTIRPFGPSIIRGRMTEELQQVLCSVFEQQGAKNELTPEEDNAWTLAGNLHREFLITQELLGENAQLFQDCINKGASQIYLAHINVTWESQQGVVTPKHREIVEEHFNNVNLTVGIHTAWGNISVAGDFNPAHQHTGEVSGVGYLKLPDDIEREWLLEDHDPSAGMINFWDGRPNAGAVHMYRVKPVVGDIFFFPAWLPHSVHPFRSEGERWSFSFNISIKNMNEDVNLTDFEKAELRTERKRLLKEFDNAK